MTAADPDRSALPEGPADGMAARVRALDWAATPLGPIERWPASLRAAVRIVLTSRYAMWMAWGPQLTFFCNDAYLPTVGIKRDWVLGARSDHVWEEIWPDIGPRIERVLTTGEATWDEGLLLFLERSGFPEETYHTFSYSPLADDAGAIAGMLCVVTEVTERVIDDRRLRMLRELGARMGRTTSAVWEAVRQSLAENAQDLPFTLAYAFGETDARLVCATGMEPGAPLAPLTLARDAAAPWPLGAVAGGASFLRLPVPDDAGPVPAGPWDDPPVEVLVLPIAAPGEARPLGAFVVGLNPYRALDAAYRGFLDLFVGQVAAGLASANAYEAERKRAEALAEIDRAKTAFFSNVSHEFRTPLTLMLGPLEEVLAQPADAIGADSRSLVDAAHRNGLRLLRLVNALLDFSRIEAGRAQAAFRPTDLGPLTADLASSFRAATEKAGLALDVDCPPLREPVFVDRDMWETIVLNLLSNAFKFTLQGRIGVTVRGRDGGARLVVEDTGVGVPPEELPRLFERFRRVEGSAGRSFEGSGIGLALVQELVKLHGGEIAVDSAPGRGARFTIDLPAGAAHLPADQVRDAAADGAGSSRSRAYVEEAMRWLPGAGDAGILDDASQADAAAPTGERVLLADDNADLRGYIARLLTARGYAVEACGDGEAALAAIRARRPDLLVTDVMMPRLDGFGLLAAIRADPALRDLPVVMLSARAGEEAKIGGLDAGADDYLTKPFSARELLARVAANLAMARMRREAGAALAESEARFRNMAEQAPAMMWVAQADGRRLYVNRAWRDFTGQSEGEAMGFGWLDAVHPDDAAAARRALLDAGARRAPFRLECRLRRRDGVWRWALDAAAPRFGAQGAFLGHVGSVVDITERKDAEAALEHRVAEALAGRAAAEETLRQSQKMEAVGQLTGGVAHDFNNLLTVITGNIGIAARALGAEASPRAARALDNAMRGAERAAALTHRLLAFSRRQPLDPKPVDVDQLIGGMSDLLRRSLGETIVLDIAAAPDLWRTEVDPNQLESAILNLAVNARDAMPSGGRLRIEAGNFVARDGAPEGVAPGDYVLIVVADEGVGMTPQTLARVFEPFFTTKEVGKGTGLGLSMVYGFAKQSGGHVAIDAKPGEGAVVRLYLPRFEGGLTASPADAGAEPKPAGRAETILVVEDDEDVRGFSVEALRELGYRVVEAHDGPSALQALAGRGDVALLFTDVVMPGMSGAQLAEEARRLVPGLRVLFASGYPRDAVMHDGRLDAGVDIIAKPFAYQALATRIGEMLARAPGR